MSRGLTQLVGVWHVTKGIVAVDSTLPVHPRGCVRQDHVIVNNCKMLYNTVMYDQDKKMFLM